MHDVQSLQTNAQTSGGYIVRKYLAAIVCFFVSIGMTIAATYYSADFDNTNPGKKELQGGEIDIVNNPHKDTTNSSDKAGRCRINNGGKRAEYSSPRLSTNEKTFVYRWMYYIPADVLTAELGWRVISQWKTWPCEVCTNYLNEICYGCGGIFNEVRIDMNNNNPQFDVKWRAKPDCREYERPVITGRWVSFRLEIYWTNTSNGYTKLWIDNNQVAQHNNIKTLFDRFPSNGSCNIYWGVGLYGPLSGSMPYVDLYIDNISISDADETGIETVFAPKQAASPGISAHVEYARGARTADIQISGANQARELTIQNIDGRHVRRISLPQINANETVSVTWDGLDEHGRVIAAGAYVITAGVHTTRVAFTR